ncbi:MAG: sodium/solute symporter [Phycisphaeraceae bacterium]|nr:sodium/solute symporter [Phycisphaeraceae bacterium]
MTLNWLDQVIIIVYLLGMAGIGVYFAKRNKSTEEYFAGGRSHGGILLGLSLVGAVISSVTFVAHPADTFKTSWFRYIPSLMLPFSVLFAGYYFVPLFRRSKVTSAYEYLESRFGPWVRFYAACTYSIVMLIRLSAVLYLFSVVIQLITGLDPNLCILIAGVITALYTVVGGLNAVIWTDAIQTIVLLGGGFAILIVLILKIDGGLMEVFSSAWADNKLSFADLNTATGQLEPTRLAPTLWEKSISMMFIVGIFAWLADYITNQQTVQRYIAARSAYEARKSILVCAGMSLPIWTLFMFIGTCMYVFYKQYPDAIATAIRQGTEGHKAEEILPYFLTTHVPVGIVGIVVAGVAAAAMSTLSSCMNAFASVVTVDIYKRQMVKNKTDRHYLVVGWILTGLSAAIMILGAWALLHADTMTLNDFLIIVNNIIQSGIIAVFLLGFLTKRANAWSVGIGIILALLFSAWCALKAYLPPAWQMPFHLYYASLLGNLVMFAVGYFLGLLIPNTKPVPPELTIWGHAEEEAAVAAQEAAEK